MWVDNFVAIRKMDVNYEEDDNILILKCRQVPPKDSLISSSKSPTWSVCTAASPASNGPSYRLPSSSASTVQLPSGSLIGSLKLRASILTNGAARMSTGWREEATRASTTFCNSMGFNSQTFDSRSVPELASITEICLMGRPLVLSHNWKKANSSPRRICPSLTWNLRKSLRLPKKRLYGWEERPRSSGKRAWRKCKTNGSQDKSKREQRILPTEFPLERSGSGAWWGAKWTK